MDEAQRRKNQRARRSVAAFEEILATIPTIAAPNRTPDPDRIAYLRQVLDDNAAEERCELEEERQRMSPPTTAKRGDAGSP